MGNKEIELKTMIYCHPMIYTKIYRKWVRGDRERESKSGNKKARKKDIFFK
jgi:hypothetical protein